MNITTICSAASRHAPVCSELRARRARQIVFTEFRFKDAKALHQDGFVDRLPHEQPRQPFLVEQIETSDPGWFDLLEELS